MKKLFLILIGVVLLTGCETSRRAGSTNQLLEDSGHGFYAAPGDPAADPSAVLSSLIKNQFGTAYTYGKLYQPKVFTQDKANVLIDGKKVDIFVNKDAQALRPLFVIKVMNNASCDDKYKAYLKRIVTLRSAYKLTVKGSGTEDWDSYQFYVKTGISKSVTEPSSATLHLSEDVSIGSSDPLTSVIFSENNAKNTVCVNSLISTSKFGVGKETYKDEMPVFFVELEMAQ